MHFTDVLGILAFTAIFIGYFCYQVARFERMDKDSEEWRILCAIYDADGEFM